MRCAKIVLAAASMLSWIQFSPPLLAQQGMLIPAYFYPGPLWAQASAPTATAVQIMVANPFNGPGPAPDPNYVGAIRNAQSAGIRVIGYVHTSYATRPLADVLADIQKHIDWYAVDGVFIDEVASGTALLDYYAALSAQVRSIPGMLVVFNPGVYPAQDYMAFADVIVTFEGSYHTYRRAGVPAWAAHYAPERFCHIVYACSSARRMEEVVDRSRQRNVGLLYVTHDVLSNPYDTLPFYWGQELAAISAP